MTVPEKRGGLDIDRARHSECLSSAKVFDCLGARRPILAVAPPQGELVDLVSETNAGYVVDYQDKHRIKEIISALFRKWQADDCPPTPGTNVEAYDRERLAERLAHLFNDTLERRHV